MAIDADAFKSALALFPAGVTVVTVQAGEVRHGLTVSAFASVSADPPLVSVTIDQRNHAHELLEQDGAVFAVNFLHRDQIEISNRFAWVKDEDRFALGNWSTAETGAPVLDDAIAWLDCTIHSQLAAGSHTIYVGEVQASALPAPDAEPLLYWNRDYRSLALGSS